MLHDVWDLLWWTVHTHGFINLAKGVVHLFALVWILHLNVPIATDADQEPNEGENDFSDLLNKFQEANTNTDLWYSLWFYAGPDINIYSKHRLWETHTDRRSLRIIIFEKRRKKRVQPKTRSVAYTSPHALSHSVIRMLVAVVYCRVMGSGWGSADIGANISLSPSPSHAHTQLLIKHIPGNIVIQEKREG